MRRASTRLMAGDLGDLAGIGTHGLMRIPFSRGTGYFTVLSAGDSIPLGGCIKLRSTDLGMDIITGTSVLTILTGVLVLTI